jgi:hypothetical protein
MGYVTAQSVFFLCVAAAVSHFTEQFMNSEGMNYERFKEHKKRVNQSKKFIKLQIEDRAFLLSQKDGGQVAVLRINQDYSSDNFKSHTRKILYLREEQGRCPAHGSEPVETNR